MNTKMENADMPENPIGAWTCPACGTEMAAGTNFCSTCGASRTSLQGEADPEGMPRKPIGGDTGVLNCVHDRDTHYIDADHDRISYLDAVRISQKTEKLVAGSVWCYNTLIALLFLPCLAIVFDSNLFDFWGDYLKSWCEFSNLWIFLIAACIVLIGAAEYRQIVRKSLLKHDLDNANAALSKAKVMFRIAAIIVLTAFFDALWYLSDASTKFRYQGVFR